MPEVRVDPQRVILLPGVITPAGLAYGALVEALDGGVEAIAKELEVYAGDGPPDGYGLDDEVAGVLREADARGWERFHLVGFSGGGAAALATAARQPERLLSLSLFEPAWAGDWEVGEAERDVRRELERLGELPPGDFMHAFARLQLRPASIRPRHRPAPSRRGWRSARPGSVRSRARSRPTTSTGTR